MAENADEEDDEQFNNDEIRDRIRKKRVSFVNEVNPDRMSDWLIQEDIISIADYQDIRARNPNQTDRCRSLLDSLFELSNPKTFIVVRQALRKENRNLLQQIDMPSPITIPPSESEIQERIDKNNRKIQDLEKENEGLKDIVLRQCDQIRNLKTGVGQLAKASKTRPSSFM